jgi:DNA repair ATPase RecN
MASENSSKRIKQKTIGGKSPENFSQKVKEFIAKKKSRKQYEILENGENPVSTASTSQGKRASMFLDIKLNSFLAGQRRSVLLVDQIEDNIDNKYIGTELVRLLRDLKANMQVILVTHNPSIAIYGDAENIIIADNSEGKITFSQGGLENKAVRDEACRILDGGDIAFKNRMDKYNISRMR